MVCSSWPGRSIPPERPWSCQWPARHNLQPASIKRVEGYKIHVAHEHDRGDPGACQTCAAARSRGNPLFPYTPTSGHAARWWPTNSWCPAVATRVLVGWAPVPPAVVDGSRTTHSKKAPVNQPPPPTLCTREPPDKGQPLAPNAESWSQPQRGARESQTSNRQGQRGDHLGFSRCREHRDIPTRLYRGGQRNPRSTLAGLPSTKNWPSSIRT